MVIRHWLHFYADWGLDSASFLNNCCINLPCMNLHWSWRLYDHFYFECSLCHALMSKICISKQNVLTLQHLCLTLFIFFFFSTLLHFSILDLKMNKYCELQAQTENTNWKPTALFIWCYKSQFLYFMWFYFFSTHLSNIIEVLRRHIVCILFWPCFLPSKQWLITGVHSMAWWVTDCSALCLCGLLLCGRQLRQMLRGTHTKLPERGQNSVGRWRGVHRSSLSRSLSPAWRGREMQLREAYTHYRPITVAHVSTAVWLFCV